MQASQLKRAISFAIVVLVVGCTQLPSAALAAPTAAEIQQKQAEKAAALADLDAMQADLSAQIDQYTKLGEEIAQVRQDIAQAEADAIVIDAELAAKEEAVRTRLVQMYRDDDNGVLGILLGAESFDDLVTRTHYLLMINQRDMQLRQELRLAKSESLWIHNALTNRAAELAELQAKADTDRSVIEDRMAAQESKAAALGTDIAEMMRAKAAADAAAAMSVGGKPNSGFDPDTVISDSEFRASGSMNVDQVQAFLDKQPGTLKSYNAPDHNGQVKTTAQMIVDAALAWNVNPKVILVKLQKEQSLLADATPSQSQLDWATGCGKADSHTYTQYRGFGNQVWFGASKLHQNAAPWTPGISMKIDGTTIHPTNASTYSLYKYTPHFRGTMSFWLLYWRYFGDPRVG